MLGAPPTKRRIHAAARYQLLQVVDTFEARPLAIVDDQSGDPIGLVELFRAAASIPLRFELGQPPMDLAEIDPIAAGIRSSVRGVLDARARDHLLNDLAQFANPLVLLGLPHVEGLVMDNLPRRR